MRTETIGPHADRLAWLIGPLPALPVSSWLAATSACAITADAEFVHFMHFAVQYSAVAEREPRGITLVTQPRRNR
ncbi:MAG: hypothetical protein A3F74_10285 [Betaproteobacteria bacterium RIFCSPLOWO2_12_FULL_62_58]|nr:MAG: hypothetical protein A3F74_10285 [Betaproteobacteria bacterium RIFCSPLOWO2_12_FULL_62_58]